MKEKERIMRVIDYLKEKKVIEKNEDLCLKLGIKSSSYLSQLIHHRVGNTSFMRQLCRLDDNLNFEWLYREEGEMLFSDSDKPQSQEIIEIEGETESITPCEPLPQDGYISLSMHREQMNAKDEQINRLLSIIEKLH